MSDERTKTTTAASVSAAISPAVDDGVFAASQSRMKTEVTILPWSVSGTVPVSPAIDCAAASGRCGARAGHASAFMPEIDGFEIRGRLGEGGMGEVYRAFDRQLKVEVALKVPRSLTSDAKPVFLDEAQKLAQVQHRNVVAIRTWGESNGYVYFTMNLVPGPSASRLIHRFGREKAHRLPLARLLQLAEVAPDSLASELRPACSERRPYYRLIAHWIAEAAEGLAAAHKRGILHRDIKPGNFLLAADGRLMVTDFGLAKTSREIADSAAGIQGTYPYIAPERILEGQTPVDARADLWSLGATLYEFLTYHRAYPRAGPGVLKDIVTKSPVRPRRIVSAVPAGLEEVCLKAMDRDPDQRYQNAAELAEALYAWAGFSPHRRPRRAVALGVLTGLVAAGGVGAYPPAREWVAAQAEVLAPTSGSTLGTLEVNPALVVLQGVGQVLDLRQTVRVVSRHADQSVATIDLARCEISALGSVVTLDATRVRAVATGGESIEIRYGDQRAFLRVRVDSATPQVAEAPADSTSIGAPTTAPAPLGSARVPQPPRVFLALNEDLNTRDRNPATAGGVVTRVLNERLLEAGCSPEVGWSEAAWNPSSALAAGAAREADIVVFGLLAAYPKDSIRVSYQPDHVIGWEITVDLQFMNVATGERRFVSASEAVHPSAAAFSGTLPGETRELRHLLMRAWRSDDDGGGGAIDVVKQWFPTD